MSLYHQNKYTIVLLICQHREPSPVLPSPLCYGAGCRSDDLLGHLTLGIIVIPDSINYNLTNDKLIGIKSNITLGGTENFTILILIIVLFLAQNVNRADNISFTVIDILVVSGKNGLTKRKAVDKSRPPFFRKDEISLC